MRPHDQPQGRPPAIERRAPPRPPESLLVPEARRAVDGGEQRADRADAASGDDVELDAGLVQRAQHAGVIRAGRAGSRSERGRCGVVGSRARRTVKRRARSFARASSWMVMSLTISNSRVPPGVTTLTESPGSLFRNARPIGEVVEIRPFAASASSGMTSWKTSLSPVLSIDVDRRSEAGAIGRNPIDVDQRDLGHALLQHADARLDEPLPFLGGRVLGVLAQVAELAGALDFLRQLELQLASRARGFRSSNFLISRSFMGIPRRGQGDGTTVAWSSAWSSVMVSASSLRDPTQPR